MFSFLGARQLKPLMDQQIKRKRFRLSLRASSRQVDPSALTASPLATTLTPPPPAIVQVFCPSNGERRGGSSTAPRIQADTRPPQWADGLRGEASRRVRGADRRASREMMMDIRQSPVQSANRDARLPGPRITGR